MIEDGFPDGPDRRGRTVRARRETTVRHKTSRLILGRAGQSGGRECVDANLIAIFITGLWTLMPWR